MRSGVGKSFVTPQKHETEEFSDKRIAQAGVLITGLLGRSTRVMSWGGAILSAVSCVGNRGAQQSNNTKRTIAQETNTCEHMRCSLKIVVAKIIIASTCCRRLYLSSRGRECEMKFNGNYWQNGQHCRPCPRGAEKGVFVFHRSLLLVTFSPLSLSLSIKTTQQPSTSNQNPKCASSPCRQKSLTHE